jgi:Fe(3+) dicitrate transport protein
VPYFPLGRLGTVPSIAVWMVFLGAPAYGGPAEDAEERDAYLELPEVPRASLLPPTRLESTDSSSGSESSETIAIQGGEAKRDRIAGSAYFFDEKELERFEHIDIHRVLNEVPGVYVRGEDGYGLRPNIGLRGVSSDRSSKITLMEDGILFGPAPYSAPAAYYFPLVTRMTGIEVFKGPSAVAYGPQTVGGAINFLSRPIPEKMQGSIDLAAGSNVFGKAHGYWGTSGKNWGVLLEGVRLQTDGFKELDGGGDTGFDKNELLVKTRVNSDPSLDVQHSLEMRFMFSNETSNETYLGLTDDDFRAKSNRRYFSSNQDRMEWERYAYAATYALTMEALQVSLTGYRHDLDRTWRRVNGFRGGPPLEEILANPDSGQNAVFVSVLRGDEDSVTEDQTLLIANNKRTFVSQGVQLSGSWQSDPLDWIRNELRFGVRFHHDDIERDHTQDGLRIQSRTLVPDGRPRQAVTVNNGFARAWALYAQDELTLGPVLLTPALRVELIETGFGDRLTGRQDSRSDTVLLPGIGAFVQATSWLGFLAGVHRGFSPVSPGQAPEIQPESSINYEAGIRVVAKATRAELIGFFNDYSNLTGECTFSSGCTEGLLDTQFNGGTVRVYGLEALVSQTFQLPWDVSLSGKLAYTLTLSEFLSSFSSENPQFGDVEVGDELAYLPNHQGSLILGLGKGPVEVNVALRYVSEMRDQAGQGSIPENERVEPNLITDLAITVAASPSDFLYVNLNNAFNETYIASRRPFGARPGQPLQLLLGYKHRFGP